MDTDHTRQHVDRDPVSEEQVLRRPHVANDTQAKQHGDAGRKGDESRKQHVDTKSKSAQTREKHARAANQRHR